MPSLDSLKALKTLQVDDKTYHYFSLPDAARSLGDLDTVADVAESAAGKPAALGRRKNRHRRRSQVRLPPGSRSAAPIAKSSTARRGC
jgi:hypothetical protein